MFKLLFIEDLSERWCLKCQLDFMTRVYRVSGFYLLLLNCSHCFTSNMVLNVFIKKKYEWLIKPYDIKIRLHLRPAVFYCASNKLVKHFKYAFSHEKTSRNINILICCVVFILKYVCFSNGTSWISCSCDTTKDYWLF